MRIISGTKRGKKLFTPADERIRPTADRAREALFSILYAKYFDTLDGVRVMDIFSGRELSGLRRRHAGQGQFALWMWI